MVGFRCVCELSGRESSMKISTHFLFSLHIQGMHYSFIPVLKKSAHNSTRLALCFISGPHFLTFNPKFPHSFRGIITKSDFYSPCDYLPSPNPTYPRRGRIWGGAPEGRVGFPFSNLNPQFPHSFREKLQKGTLIPLANISLSKCVLHLGRAGVGHSFFLSFSKNESFSCRRYLITNY